jgi:hypothetical protein
MADLKPQSPIGDASKDSVPAKGWLATLYLDETALESDRDFE